MKTPLQPRSFGPANSFLRRLLGFFAAYTLLVLLTSSWTARQVRHSVQLSARLPVSTPTAFAPLPHELPARVFVGMNAH